MVAIISCDAITIMTSFLRYLSFYICKLRLAPNAAAFYCIKVLNIILSKPMLIRISLAVIKAVVLILSRYFTGLFKYSLCICLKCQYTLLKFHYLGFQGPN